MNNKKAQATIQLTLVILSIFAFAYILHQSDSNFKEVGEYNKIYQQKRLNILANITKNLIAKLTSPLIPLVSADTGCCDKTINNARCSVVSQEQCTPGRLFAANTLCDQTSFCQLGCCVDDESGTCDKNTIQNQCQGVWTADKNCNLPQCQLGCCNLGNSGILSTQKQCDVYTTIMVLGENKETDWDPTISEAACVMSSLFEAKGACLTASSDGSKACEMMTNKECLSLTGSLENFVEGKLCTSPSLNTSCVKTAETTCVEGKDQVYFVDSCGNPSNIYDSSRVNDPSYWDAVIASADSCNAGDGNANSASCGNCDRFKGGKCSDAQNATTKPIEGDNYCKQTSCYEDGTFYDNGESWCVYDGAIGNGDDVVGSRHWRHVCNLGEIIVEPCADYRNQICVQSNTLEAVGETVDFRQAFCRPNNWRNCILANGEEAEGDISFDCTNKEIKGGGQYDLTFTAPAFPPGFGLSGQGGNFQNGESICSAATLNCTYTEIPKTWGGCEVLDDGRNCKSPEVVQQMNDLCRSFGDCGLSANIEGNVQDGYKIITDGGDLDEEFPSGEYKSKLAGLSVPIKGKFASIGNLEDYLAAAGLYQPTPETPEEYVAPGMMQTTLVGMGAGAAGLIAASAGLLGSSAVVTSQGLAYSSVLGSSGGGGFIGFGTFFAAAAVGAMIGGYLGSYLAKAAGLSPGGSMLMTYGGAIAGAGAAIYAYAAWQAGAALCTTGAGCIVGIVLVIIGVVMMVVSLFFGGSDCEVTTVQFTCEAWQPPTGGADCHICNEDPQKPCSEYRCQSLGAACEFLNPGTEDEVCAAMANDARPPVITMGNASDGTLFTPTADGFKITKEDGSCLNAYETKLISFSTNKPAQCRFALDDSTEFENMPASFGTAYYVYNHVLPFQLPDPSHGMSQGIDWTGELNFYILCQDAYANAFRVPYKIETCIYQGKDITPPTVAKTNPATNTLLSYNTTSVSLTAYITEPSTCKWSSNDDKFDTMTQPMTCEQDITKRGLYGYPCTAELPITNVENPIYIACQDQPWLNGTVNESDRNAMTGNIRINLNKVESPIKIENIVPKEDLETYTVMKTVELGVQTADGGRWHTCSYSFSGYDNMVLFLHTGERAHTQPGLNLAVGTHRIYVECEDETGDKARGETIFQITQDTFTPLIARIFKQGSTIKVITTEQADCRYSTDKCSFPFSDGTTMGYGLEHSLDSKIGEIYYIKCVDEFGNGNDTASCSKTITGGIE